MTDTLVQFVFGAGVRLLDQCETARQCEVEVVRIAVRTQNILGTLKDSQEHFQKQTGLEASLLELKAVFETVHALVGRCGVPVSLAKRASLMWQRGNPNKQALINAETRLEQITQDLGLPMLTDIKQQLNRMQEEALEMNKASAAASAGNAEAIAEVVRNEIRRAMNVRGKSGLTIEDTINEGIADLECADGDDDVSRAPASEEGGKSEKGASSRRASKAGGLVIRLGRVRFEDLKEGEVLGEGTFGTVLSGMYRGRDVAVKKARGAIGSASIMEAFRQEAEIHYAMRHPNVVEVIAFGLGDAEHPPCLVMERMHETLYDLLGVEGIDMPLGAKISIVRDVSEGMRFLHTHGIVHRDLKSLNVLLDEAWVAKISDFGLAKVNSTVAASTGGGGYHSKVGSDFWMAPEVHSHHKATRASDVFSMHVVMWECIAQERAGTGKPIGERLLSNSDAHLPLGDMDCSDEAQSNIRDLVERCGAKERSERPTMDEVCTVVGNVLRHLENPDEHPLSAVAPRSRQEARTLLEVEEEGLKPSSSATKDHHRTQSHGTIATAVISIDSTAGGSSSYASVKSMGSEKGARRPLPPLPPRVASTPVIGTASRRGSQGGPTPPVPVRTRKVDDRGALLSLFRKCSPLPPAGNPTAVSGWAIHTGWGAPFIDMSRWYGVSTRHYDVGMAGSERVTGLALPGNGLCGTIAEEVFTLDRLVDLNLKDNNLAGDMPASIGNLRVLETLDLSGNKLIVGAIPPEISGLLSLTSIELHHIGLYGDIPATLGNLCNLERLDLSDNGLWGSIPKELGTLKTLKVLRLGTNRLSGEIPDSLTGLDDLVELHLGGNKLTGTILAVSDTWPKLEILDLSDNLLEGWIPPELLELESVRHLRLYRNFGISGGIPPRLGSMTSLEELDLSATQLGGEIPKELGNLSRLTKLTLGCCKLVGAIPYELGRLTQLQNLGLFDNNLVGNIPHSLLMLPAMRSFNLERNKLNVTKAIIGGTKSEVKKILPKRCIIRL